MILFVMIADYNDANKQRKEKTMNKLAIEVIAEIKSKPGYSFDPKIVEDICEAGIDGISVGTVIYEDEEQRVIMGVGELICTMGENEKRTQLTPEVADGVVKMIAVKKSRCGYGFGNF